MFTVPAGATGIIKSALLENNHSVDVKVRVFLRTAGVDFKAVEETVAAGTAKQLHSMFTVVHEGESVVAHSAPLNVPVKVAVSGSLLAGSAV